MSLEVKVICQKNKLSLENLINHLKKDEIIEEVYEFDESEECKECFFYPENSICGFSVKLVKDNNTDYHFKQGILPSFNDWQTLIYTFQYLIRNKGCKLIDKNNNPISYETFEEWKFEEFYNKKHLPEAIEIINKLKNKDSFVIPTYRFKLEILKKHINLSSMENQLKQLENTLKQQVNHFMDCLRPSIYYLCDMSGNPHSTILWRPMLQTLTWEVDWVNLSKMHFGESKIIEFQDLLDILGDRVKDVSSPISERKRFELPALDFSENKEKITVKKILEMRSALKH